MGLLRGALGRASPPGTEGRLSILIFHRVLPQPDPLFPGEAHAAFFDAMLGWVKDWFNVLSLEEAVDRLKRGSLPARALAITFDDGYADNATVALPLLKKHGLPATFFIATGFLDGGIMWNDVVISSIRHCPNDLLDLDAIGLGRYPLTDHSTRRQAIDQLLARLKYLEPAARREAVQAVAQAAQVDVPKDLMMTSAQVRELYDQGMQIGAHTCTHPILARVDRRTAKDEIEAGRAKLEQLVRTPVRLFAYPNGRPGTDYTEEHVGLVREMGFQTALSTAWGAACGSSDYFQLPRFTPWDRTRLRFGLRMIKNLLQPAPR